MIDSDLPDRLDMPYRRVLESIGPRARERGACWAYCADITQADALADVNLAGLVLDYKAGRGPFIP